MRFEASHPYASISVKRRTMLVLQDISNTVDCDLKFTIDCPSLNSNARLPILDLQFWIQDGKLIRHGFYKKPMVPERNVMAQSALSSRVKRYALFSEGMRRLSALNSYTPT